MVKIHLNKLLAERDKTIYWLSKKTGVRYATLWQLSRDEVCSLLNLKTLEKICRALECTPGDVITLSHLGRKKARSK